MIADLASAVTQMFEASLAVGLLILFILAVRGTVARRFGPRAAYALWLLPLVRLAMPPIPIAPTPEIIRTAETAFVAFTAPLPTFEPSIVSVPTTVATETTTSSVAPTRTSTPTAIRTATTSVAMRSISAGPSASPNPVLKPIDAVPAPVHEPAPQYIQFNEKPSVRSNTGPMFTSDVPQSRFALPKLDFSGFAGPFWQSLAVIWVLITLGLALRMVVRQFVFADRIWQHTIPADPQTAAETKALARELGVKQPISVRLCPEHNGPLVCGLFRPIVVVPEDFAFRFGPQERRYALAHELLHVRRGDLFAILAMTAVRSTQWFNPFAARAVAAFRSDQEAACDATVLRSLDGHRHDYAQTLLKAVRKPSDCGPVPALTLDHGLKERLKLMNIRKTLRGGAVVVTGIAILGLVSTASYAVQEEAPDPEELDSVLDGNDDEEDTPRANRRRTGENAERAEIVRDRVASVQARLIAARSGGDTELRFAELSRARDDNRQRAIEEQRRAAEEQRERAAEQRERAREQAEAERERLAEARERQREAQMRKDERRRELDERRRETEERARELRNEAREMARELAENERERAADAREWATELRIEMSELRNELAQEAREIAEEVRHEIHIGNSGHTTIIADNNDGHSVFTMTDGDINVSINSGEGYLLLTDPMVGLEDRMAAIQNFAPEIPELPEPPTPPEVVVVEVKTADGKVIKLPESTTIVLPTFEKDMEAYSRRVEKIIADADIDGQVQAALGEDFDEKVRANTLQIRKLADQCEGHQKKSEKPMIMSSSKNGVTHKLLCFNPSSTALKSKELASFIDKRNDLSTDEKKRFKDARKGSSFAFSFDWDG